MKKIYILLTKTGTVPARVIHAVKGGTFTHTSLSLVPSTDKFYSYARRDIKNPFNAGFIVENIHTHIFALYPNCHSAVYTLTISDKAYEIMQEKITFFLNNYKKATYNFMGLLAMAFGIKMKRKMKFTCSQFVSIILNSSGEIKLPKDPYLMLPDDFMKIEGIELIYDGLLKDCKITQDDFLIID